MNNTVDIKFNFQCNNFCKFCVQGDRRNIHRDKTDNEIKRNLKLSRKDCDRVVFTGGECTIRPDIVKLTKYAKSLGYVVQIQTNGRMFAYKDFCKDMIRAGADKFAISIHGHKAKLHDYLTSAEGSFKQSTAGIKNLLSFNKVVVTNTVITKLNYSFLPDIAMFLMDLGVLQYQFAFPHILGRARENADQIIARKKDAAPYVVEGLALADRKKRIARVEAIPYCFLTGYEDCVSDKYIPDTKVFDVKIIGNFNRWRKVEGKCKGPRCAECKHFQYCEGPWREYPEIFGWDEFIPVR